MFLSFVFFFVAWSVLLALDQCLVFVDADGRGLFLDNIDGNDGEEGGDEKAGQHGADCIVCCEL